MADELNAPKPQRLGVTLNLNPHQFGSFGLSTGGKEMYIKSVGMASPTNDAGQGPRGMIKGDYVQPHNGQYATGWHDPQLGLVPENNKPSA
jgi:hypothetical protein